MILGSALIDICRQSLRPLTLPIYSFHAPSEKISESLAPFNGISDTIVEETVAQTRARIAVGRQETQERVRPHLESMSSYLDEFETAGATNS